MCLNKFLYVFRWSLWLIGASAASEAYGGYVNFLVYPGNNLIADQLLGNPAGESLDTAFEHNSVPEGATFTEWDPSQLQYLPVSVYDTNSGWSINYTLTYGGGGLFKSLTVFTNTFVGALWPGFNYNNYNPPDFGQPILTNAGVFLLSCLIPIAPANFHEVVGRDPQEGEFVTTLDPLTQLETTTTFHNGSWDDGTPSLEYGQAAFFGLETVPEPASYQFLVAGILSLLSWRKLCRTS